MGEIGCVSLRYFNTYCHSENSKSQYARVVWGFIKSIRNKETPFIYGGDEQKWDLTYVNTNKRGSSMEMEKGIPGESYNIVSGTSITFNEIYKKVKEETK